MEHSNMGWPKARGEGWRIEGLQTIVSRSTQIIIIKLCEMNPSKYLIKTHITDEDITTAIEKLEKQKSMLFGSSPNHSKTVSMPAWSSSPSSRSNSLSSTPSSSAGEWPQFRDRPTNFSLSSSQMSSSPHSLSKMSSFSSSWRCSGSSYKDDRLLQMD